MRNRAKVFFDLCIVFVFLLALGISSFMDSAAMGFSEKWGNLLSENFSDAQGDEIYAIGKNSVITKQEMEQATQFYLLSGMDEQSARERANEAVFQREALYQAAVKNGYSVTDAEVWDYLEELKVTIEQVDNKADALAVMAQFETEENYWEYEFAVYQKNLPIQNYVYDMEQDFRKTTMYADGYADGQDTQGDAEWLRYFEQVKEELVLEEDFEVVSE